MARGAILGELLELGACRRILRPSAPAPFGIRVGGAFVRGDAAAAT